ncbi:uncharacterized protein AB675_5783 [Cyphellophora attinorum]|uniref:Uncharacterized protein n=1 Tax=Cyphellophora attinorum TaxID=1664694 RepID=A0A0N0NL20_9EURO|nr:uncharacterized protein AB675_5783 [Phialophora attinorum]KPI38791.1 hypothetical protein AB675_5783 [Phialophora attinorum]
MPISPIAKIFEALEVLRIRLIFCPHCHHEEVHTNLVALLFHFLDAHRHVLASLFNEHPQLFESVRALSRLSRLEVNHVIAASWAYVPSMYSDGEDENEADEEVVRGVQLAQVWALETAADDDESDPSKGSFEDLLVRCCVCEPCVVWAEFLVRLVVWLSCGVCSANAHGDRGLGFMFQVDVLEVLVDALGVDLDGMMRDIAEAIHWELYRPGGWSDSDSGYGSGGE